MDRTALTGLTLAGFGAIALLASELVGTAHASRPEDRSYLFALSSGSALYLAQRRAESARNALALAPIGPYARRLTCDRLVEGPAVTLGFRCREH